MLSLTERQETLLALVVHEYIETADPVGSKTLVQRFGLEVSPATVRNEMSALTEAGLLRQPHTSAGRVPTEEGYRYFVRRLIGDTDLPADEKRLISHQFHQARPEIDQWVRLAASVLAQHSRVLSLVTAPRPERAVFKHLELISTKPNQALLVLVLQGGDVRQQLLLMSESMDQDHLSQIADRLTRQCFGLTAGDIRQLARSEHELAAQVLELISELIWRADTDLSGEVVRDGLTNVLAQPEFAEPESARDALRLLGEQTLLEDVLTRALQPSVGGVQVVIGGEGAWGELRNWSMVLARYGAAGYATGAVGVVGPTRMSYGHTISCVRYVAGLMSELVTESFAA
jgi:heat-inducible transcriptional repressor